MDIKTCNTGIDVAKNFERFVSRDPTFSMQRTRRTITLTEDYATVPRGKVPHGTTKCTYRLGLTHDGKLDREGLGFQTQQFPRSPTDHISSEPPAQERPFQGLYDRMMQQSKYEKNTRNSNAWFPKAPKVSTISNLNSVSHNIITNGENKYSKALCYTDRQTHSFARSRGISEINDLSRITAVNRNVDHFAAMSSHERVFARKDGIFTHLYNSAARFGEDKPFKA